MIRGTGLIPFTVLLAFAKVTRLLELSWFAVLLPICVWLLVNLVGWGIVMLRMKRAGTSFLERIGRR